MPAHFQNIICAENLKDNGMNYISIFISWFLEHFTSEDISMVHAVLTIGISCVNAVYIFCVYCMLTRKTIYSKHYNITVASMVVIITSMIFAIHSSVVLSFGMLGALSIVRFRTAIKDALDIVFLFWAITAGICYGAHMAEIAILLSAILTIVIFSLEEGSVKRGYGILIVEMESTAEKELLRSLDSFCRRYCIKTKQSVGKGYKIVIEAKVKQEFEMIQNIRKIAGVEAISFVVHEGEHNY